MDKGFKVKSRNAKVYFRIFPSKRMNWEHVKVMEDRKTIYCRCLQDFLPGKEDCDPTYWNFNTDGVFYNNSQKEIYNTVMDGVLDSVASGNNAIVLAYGQTGTGKSLTVSGLHNSFEDRGVAARAISDLFKMKASLDKNTKMVILMSYVETTKFTVTDLLGDSEKLLDINSLKYVTAKKVKNEYSALKELYKAEGLREYVRNSPYASHNCNGVLTLHVITKKMDATSPVMTTSKLHIVDLAGQDSAGNLSCFNKYPQDVGLGNLAKTQLEQLLLVLCENVPEHILVKQRLSILIQYLSDSLNNYSQLRFIGHIRTTRDDLTVTISMLRFSQLIKGMKKATKLKPNVDDNVEMKLQQVLEQLDEFKKEKDLEAMFMNVNLSTNIDQERVKHMQNVVRDYLSARTNEIVLLNVTDANTVIRVFKELYNELEIEKEDCARSAYEKAYADVLATMEASSLKTDSIMSARGSKASRGNLRKSSKTRDGSMKRGSKKGERSDASGGAKLRSSLKRDKSAISLSQDKQLSGLKRSKMSTGAIGKKSLQGKRKSVSSTHTRSDLRRDSKLSKQSSCEEVVLPENMPTHQEAWSMFVADEDYGYVQLIETFGDSERAAKECHDIYLREVKKLQKVIELLELRKDEFMQAQMQRQYYQKEEFNDKGSLVITEAERVCIENIEKAEQQMVEQQEVVLKHQADLRIALSICNEGKKLISERFEQFCSKKYSMPVPWIIPITSHTEHVSSVKDEDIVCEAESLVMSQKYNNLMKYEGLKGVMEKQMMNKIRNRERNRKWVQPYAPFKI